MRLRCEHRSRDWVPLLTETEHPFAMKKLLQFITLTGWLLPTAVAGIYFGWWIKEIVIPTLKGGDFVQLYELHQVRYLDTTQACIIVAFIWVALVVFQLARRNLRGKMGIPPEGAKR